MLEGLYLVYAAPAKAAPPDRLQYALDAYLGRFGAKPAILRVSPTFFQDVGHGQGIGLFEDVPVRVTFGIYRWDVWMPVGKEKASPQVAQRERELAFGEAPRYPQDY